MLAPFFFSDARSNRKRDAAKRFSLLFLFAFLEGALLCPMINLAIDIDPSIIIIALVGAAIAFVCFLAASKLANRRLYFYLGGFLSSCVFDFLWLRLSSSIFRGHEYTFKFDFELLSFGFIVLVGHIMLETKEIIEKAQSGDMDLVMHSLSFFTNFVAVFIRELTMVMLRKSTYMVEMKKEKKPEQVSQCPYKHETLPPIA